MKRRAQKKQQKRGWQQFCRSLKRANDAHDRATSKAQKGLWPGEMSGEIGHLEAVYFIRTTEDA